MAPGRSQSPRRQCWRWQNRQPEVQDGVYHRSTTGPRSITRTSGTAPAEPAYCVSPLGAAKSPPAYPAPANQCQSQKQNQISPSSSHQPNSFILHYPMPWRDFILNPIHSNETLQNSTCIVTFPLTPVEIKDERCTSEHPIHLLYKTTAKG